MRPAGYRCRGGDHDGFIPRDEIVAHLKACAASFDAPMHEGVGAMTCAASPMSSAMIHSSGWRAWVGTSSNPIAMAGKTRIGRDIRSKSSE